VLRAGIQHQVDGVASEHCLPVNAMPAENDRGKFGLQRCEAKAIGMIMLGDPSTALLHSPHSPSKSINARLPTCSLNTISLAVAPWLIGGPHHLTLSSGSAKTRKCLVIVIFAITLCHRPKG